MTTLYTNIHTPKKQLFIVAITITSLFLIISLLFCVLFSYPHFQLALAASDRVDLHAKDVYTSDSFTGTICGVTDTFTEKAHLTQFHIRSGNNGHFTIQWIQTVKVYDSNGKLIATSPIVEHTTGIGGTDKIHDKLKIPLTCTGASETPGKSSSVCFFISIVLEFDPEGSLKVTDYHALIC